MDLIKKTKEYFLENAEKNLKKRHFSLITHVPRVEKWALKTAKNYPEVDKEVLTLAVWLHDIGFYLGENEDHAVNSEIEVRNFLRGYEKVDQVAHCVRSHRCGDVMPKTIEAKILAFSDSASHMTDFVYLDILRMWGRDRVLEKLDRDWRDVQILPEGQELKCLYERWKMLIDEMPEWVFDKEEEQKKVMNFTEKDEKVYK